jgi:hypothetical protein
MENWTIYTAETVFNFGRNRGKTLEEVAKCDAQYILWCVRNIDKFLISKEDLVEYKNKYPINFPLTITEPGQLGYFTFNIFDLVDSDLAILDNKWESYEDYVDMQSNANWDYYDDYSIDNNPYYNDNLDMDQQDPEFWDSF